MNRKNHRHLFTPENGQASSIILTKFLLQVEQLPEAGEDNTFSYKENLDLLFETKYREVLIYTATVNFSMLGNVCRAPIADREVKAGNLILIREDARDTRNIDLQILTKFNDEVDTRWFTLTRRQYGLIKKYLKLVSQTTR